MLGVPLGRCAGADASSAAHSRSASADSGRCVPSHAMGVTQKRNKRETNEALSPPRSRVSSTPASTSASLIGWLWLLWWLLWTGGGAGSEQFQATERRG
eukprot:scaffold139460_cov133-Phaeocystis_antarctica.AAC.5